MLSDLGCRCVLLRKRSDIGSFDGIVLPGGESTVHGKLLNELDMMAPLKEMIDANTPVLATCAGLILLAKQISNDPNEYFGTLPVSVKRNAYGRQLGSFRTKAPFGNLGEVNMTFIRAPFITQADSEVQVLSVVNDNIVAVRYGNQLGVSFHPELDESLEIHRMFLSF